MVCSLRASFRPNATVVPMLKKYFSDLAVDGFHVIAVIAMIHKKVNEDQGDLCLKTSFTPFSSHSW